MSVSHVNDPTFRYHAFISYSHQDKQWGNWLHKSLETFPVPKALIGNDGRDGPIPRRVFPVFRDREELPTASTLTDNIENALAQSRYLIVICSPRAASSRWVDEEIKVFKSLGREDRVLCLIVDGEPNASDKPALDAEECFPESVRFRVDENGDLTEERTEPIAADARAHGDGREDAKLKLLAGLLGVGFDDLKRRELRRRQRRMVIATSVMALVTGIMAVLSLTAWFGWQRAEQQERLALKARDQAETIATTMLCDFRDKLEPLGQLELLKSNALVVRNYYLELPTEHTSAATERRRGVALMNVGDVLRLQGADEEAGVAFTESERIFSVLRTAEPDNHIAQRDWTVIANRIAAQHQAMGRLDQANDLYTQSAAVTNTLLEQQNTESHRRDLMVVYQKLSQLMLQTGQHQMAKDHLEAALSLARKNVEANPQDKQSRIDLGVVLDTLASWYQERRDKDRALQIVNEGIPNDRQLVADHPEDFLLKQRLAKGLGRLGQLHFELGNYGLAEQAQTERWQILKRLVSHDPTNHQWQRSEAVSFLDIARIKQFKGEVVEARRDYVRSIQWFRSFASKRPDDLESQFDLAIVYETLGDLDQEVGLFSEAMSEYQEALDVVEGLIANSDASDRWTNIRAGYLGKFGEAASRFGDYDTARSAIEQGVAIMEMLVEKDAGNRQYQRDLSILLGRLAYLERISGRLVRAEANYARAMKLDEALMNAHPDDAEAVRDLAVTLFQLGRVYQAAEVPAGAQMAFESALTYRTRLVTEYPDNLGWRADKIETLVALGDVHSSINNFSAARAQYQTALQGYAELVGQTGNEPSWRREMAFVHNRIGQSFSLEGRTEEALSQYEAAFVIAEELARTDPDNIVWQTDFVISLRVIAQGAKLPEERDKALSYNRRALEILERLDTMGALPSTFQSWISQINLDIQELSSQ